MLFKPHPGHCPSDIGDGKDDGAVQGLVRSDREGKLKPFSEPVAKPYFEKGKLIRDGAGFSNSECNTRGVTGSNDPSSDINLESASKTDASLPETVTDPSAASDSMHLIAPSLTVVSLAAVSLITVLSLVVLCSPRHAATAKGDEEGLEEEEGKGKTRKEGQGEKGKEGEATGSKERAAFSEEARQATHDSGAACSIL